QTSRGAKLHDCDHVRVVSCLAKHQILPLPARGIPLSLYDPTRDEAPHDVEYREVILLHRGLGMGGHDVPLRTDQRSHPPEDALEQPGLLRCVRQPEGGSECRSMTTKSDTSLSARPIALLPARAESWLCRKSQWSSSSASLYARHDAGAPDAL